MTRQPNPLVESGKVQKSGRMRAIEMRLSQFSRLFGHRLWFAHHFKASSFRSRHASLTPWCFSTQFGLAGCCAQVLQKNGHHAPHLSGSEDLPPPFPGTIESLTTLARQDQWILSLSQDQAPTLKWLRSTDLCLCPEQILLEEPRGVLMGKPALLGRRHFRKRQWQWPNPTKPTFPRITLGIGCLWSQHPIHRHLNLSRLANVQMVPSGKLNGSSLRVLPFPLFIWLPPALRLATLKEGSIQRHPPILRAAYRGAIQFAITLQTHQRSDLEPLASLEKGSGHATFDLPTSGHRQAGGS